MPEQRNIVIGVDLDGVCADFYGRMRQIAAEWFERPIGELPVEVSYALSCRNGGSGIKAIMIAFTVSP